MRSIYNFMAAKYDDKQIWGDENGIIHFYVEFKPPYNYRYHESSLAFNCKYIVPLTKVNKCIHLAARKILYYTRYKEEL